MVYKSLASCIAAIALLASKNSVLALDDRSSSKQEQEPVVHDDDIKMFNEHYARVSKKVDDFDFVVDNHDMGPGWPEPGNASDAIVASIAADSENERRISRSSFPTIVQPISIVNFYKSDGTGKKSYGEIMDQIDMLNKAYSGTDAQSGGYGKPRDTGIRFQLAGIRYVQNDSFFLYCTLPSTIAKARPRYMMDADVHLNIYICWCQNNLGLAWLPYDSWFGQHTGEDHYALGATVHWDLLPGNHFRGGLWNQGKILVHEVGHCYGLKHPYEGGCVGSESNSDHISDTPRMNGNPLQSCQKLGRRDSCRSDPGADDLGNYMIATGDSCRNHFTAGQIGFMQSTIRKFKPTLMKQLPPACVAAVDSSDASPDLQPCLDGTVQNGDNGRKWCRTDPDDASVWAWACCPSSGGKGWGSDSCRQGTPDFGVNRGAGRPPVKLSSETEKAKHKHRARHLRD